MAERSADVQDHWTRTGVLGRIDAALRERGEDPERLGPDSLAAMEHLHSGGLATTRDQAAAVGIAGDMHVLDVGCGIGGPARYLAHNFGCRVSGIDLTGELVETARILNRRRGLEALFDVQQGDALDLPFPDGQFDVVWSQNVTMNIEDKAGFLGEMHRVLKPGGRFTYTEYALGPEGDPEYPVTWAYTPEISFLIPPAEMRRQVEAARFNVVSWADYTTVVVGSARRAREQAASGPANPLGNHLVFGADQPARGANTARNMAEGRIVYLMVVAEKA